MHKIYAWFETRKIVTHVQSYSASSFKSKLEILSREIQDVTSWCTSAVRLSVYFVKEISSPRLCPLLTMPVAAEVLKGVLIS